MEKEKLINEIGHTIESIKTHVNRIKSEHYKVHKVDVDLLIEKTRQVYDQLINLDGMQKPFEKKTVEEVEKKIEVITASKEPEQEMPEKKLEEASSSVDEMPEVMIDPEEQEEETLVREDEKKASIEETQKHFKPEEQEEETIINVLKKDVPDEKPGEHIKPAADEIIKKVDIPNEKEMRPKSTIDLFSTSAEPTLSDRLKKTEQPTIADKITKNTINELRKAIGINEKFLFINELFNGDMSRYNKIIDELDQLATLEGANTYMLELKIQSQWQDDNEALIKLTELLHRKFVNE
ncbi:MAG: hypothetical protein KQH67_02670 [Bacteroidetes bacterium]|nr:hypothetical protein [Bacteroidota bacterium]